jgi:hypothetical protein
MARSYGHTMAGGQNRLRLMVKIVTKLTYLNLEPYILLKSSSLPCNSLTDFIKKAIILEDYNNLLVLEAPCENLKTKTEI